MKAAILAPLLVVAMSFGWAVSEGLGQQGPKKDLWTCSVEVPLPPKGGKPQPPAVASLWLPENVSRIRGLLFPGTVVIDNKLATDPVIREALAKKQMGVLHIRPGLGLNFIRGEGGKRLEQALAELAKKSNHPEVEFVPWLTTGHSAAGIFCRNVAYWKPHRMIGVLMLKSGNFHHNIEDMTRSLAGVPLMMISGEFEEYGPEGGDLGIGLRSEYSSHPTDKKRLNQTQWIMARMQMLDRRRKNPDNLWALVVHRGKGHTSWDEEMRDLTIKFIEACADARIPELPPELKSEVHCKPLTAKDGWLYDADIKNPSHKPAPYADYAGDRLLAFWVPNKTLAEAICEYHNRGWVEPDPTAGQPPEARFYPPPILRDWVDAPPPTPLTWKGGQGVWDPEGELWDEANKPTKWHPQARALINTTGSVVTLGTNMTCSGLDLGEGCTLDLQGHRLRCRWHATFAEGTTVRVQLGDGESPNRNGRLWIEGNAKLGGTLIVELTGQPKGGAYPIVFIGGLSKGAFQKIVVPEGCAAEVRDDGIVIEVPKPAKTPKPAARAP